MTTEHADDERPNSWEEIGQATEDFARRVARDAAKLAERLQEHAGDCARGVRRDRRHGCRQSAGAPEVRRVFKDIRAILTEVIDGIDQLVGRVFPESDTAPDAAWLRIVMNRAVTCVACGRTIGAGEESDAQRIPEGTAFRCLACGELASEGQPHGSPAAPAS